MSALFCWQCGSELSKKPGSDELYIYWIKDRMGAKHIVHKACIASAEEDAKRFKLTYVPVYDQSHKVPIRYDE